MAYWRCGGAVNGSVPGRFYHWGNTWILVTQQALLVQLLVVGLLTSACNDWDKMNGKSTPTMRFRWTLTPSLIGGGLGLLSGFDNYRDSAGEALGFAVVFLGYGAAGGG